MSLNTYEYYYLLSIRRYQNFSQQEIIINLKLKFLKTVP